MLAEAAKDQEDAVQKAKEDGRETLRKALDRAAKDLSEAVEQAKEEERERIEAERLENMKLPVTDPSSPCYDCASNIVSGAADFLGLGGEN